LAQELRWLAQTMFFLPLLVAVVSGLLQAEDPVGRPNILKQLTHLAAAPTGEALQVRAARGRLPGRLVADAARAPQPAMGGMTVAEAKEVFWGNIGSSLSMPVQSFVNEMIQSTTFAMASPDFKYTRVLALGYERLCDEFLASVDPELKTKVKTNLALALRFDPDSIPRDAEALKSLAAGKSEEEILALEDLKGLAPFKYTYTSGAGLIALMLDNELKPEDTIAKWSDELGLGCKSALGRDYAYYKGSVEKMAQMREMMAQMKEAEDKKKAERMAGSPTVDQGGMPRN